MEKKKYYPVLLKKKVVQSILEGILTEEQACLKYQPSWPGFPLPCYISGNAGMRNTLFNLI